MGAKFLLILAVLVLGAAVWLSASKYSAGTKKAPAAGAAKGKAKGPAKSGGGKQERAIFAGGCFWCMQPPFETLEGVKTVTAGYTGGHVDHPTYEQVSTGRTGHREAVKVIFDPDRITYPQLLEVFWRQIDPTDPDGQFVDRGDQYRSAIYYTSEEQRLLAEKSRGELAMSGRYDNAIVTDILPAGRFWPAEEYHQDYYQKNPAKYKSYHDHSGRP